MTLLPKKTLEETIRFRAETLPDIELNIYPEALVNILDVYVKEINSLKNKILELETLSKEK